MTCHSSQVSAGSESALRRRAVGLWKTPRRRQVRILDPPHLREQPPTRADSGSGFRSCPAVSGLLRVSTGDWAQYRSMCRRDGVRRSDQIMWVVGHGLDFTVPSRSPSDLAAYGPLDDSRSTMTRRLLRGLL